jgi:hypothetical protein
MKNLTLSIDEDVLARVRHYASETQTSVNALVRAYLASIATREDRARSARARIRSLSERSPARLGTKTWTRDDLHAR